MKKQNPPEHLSIISIIFSNSVALVLSLALVPVIFGLAYLVGHDYLAGNTFWGNDSYSYFSVVNWLSTHWPNLPFWFPLQGGGVSLVAGYPWGAAVLVILLDKLSQFDLVQSFRLIGFLSVPITAVGIVVFAWARLTDVKPTWMRVVLGGIAALFYTASPMAWIWLVRWGFYSENISHMFVPWTILFYDVFVERLIKKKYDWVFRLSILATALFWVMATSVHFFAGYSMVPIFAVLGVIHFVLAKENRIVVARRVILPVVLFGLALGGLFAFRYVPYHTYNQNVAEGGFLGYAPVSQASYLDTARNMLTAPIMLSLEEIEDTDMDEISIYRRTIKDMIFPFYVWILVVPTILLSWVKSKKLFLLSLYALLGFILNTQIDLYIFLSKNLGPLSAILGFMSGRVFFIPMRVIIPILAAYGAYIVWEVIGSLFLFVTKKVKPVYYTILPVKVIAVLVLTILTSGYLVFKYYNLPYSRHIANVGAFTHKPDLRDIWTRIQVDNRDLETMPKEDFVEQGGYQLVVDQLQFDNWKPFSVSSEIENELKGTRSAFDQLPDEPYRFDMSGFAGRQVMISPLVTPNPQIQVYINTLSLIYNNWNYQGQVMYTVFPLYQKPGTLTELGKWFGLNYVFLAGSGLEPVDYWRQDENWEELTPNWRKFNLPTSTVTWDNRPKVLVISDNSKFFYDQTFKYLTQGGLLFDQAIPVRGEKQVDQYDYNELKEFGAIFMRGYGYKSRGGAYKLLDKYIENGGTVIFDTGWQWLVPDYELNNAPDFMPFESLKWKTLSTKSEWSIKDTSIAHDLDPNKFGPLTWEDTSWGVSAPGKLKDWAKTIIEYDNEPLVVAGEYGKGKVIWLGFNIIPHAEAKDSPEEIRLLNRLFEWGLGGFTGVTESQVEFDQTNPDKVIFTFKESRTEPSELYFRQAYYPDWKAYLYTEKAKHQLRIHRAGPGFILIDVPKVEAGDKLLLTMTKPLLTRLAEFVSFLTLILLIVYLVFPRAFSFLRGKVSISKVKVPGHVGMRGKLKKFADSTLGDEETENY